MSETEQVLELAKMDGILPQPIGRDALAVLYLRGDIPNYLTSFDAIIRLIQKIQPPTFGYWNLNTVDPKELCEALLRWAGKLKD